MDRIEDRLMREAKAETSAADHERDARTLNALVRLFDKLTEIEDRLAEPEAKAGKTAKTAGAAHGASAPDTAAVRARLARRLAKYGRDGN